METVAVTLDEKTLSALDALSTTRKQKGGARPNRSLLVRTAVREYLERQLRLEWEEKERAILSRHRDRLSREARALIQGQARP